MADTTNQTSSGAAAAKAPIVNKTENKILTTITSRVEEMLALLFLWNSYFFGKDQHTPENFCGLVLTNGAKYYKRQLEQRIRNVQLSRIQGQPEKTDDILREMEDSLQKLSGLFVR